MGWYFEEFGDSVGSLLLKFFFYVHAVRFVQLNQYFIQ
jgi:hypothetical protein